MAFDSDESKLDLFEQGSRYDHYMELKEVFLLGIDVIDQMNPGYVSDEDKHTKANLETAVKMIEKRLAYLSNYNSETTAYSDLAREVDKCGIHRTPQLTVGSPNDNQAKQQTPQQATDSRRPEEDSGGETANA